VTKEGACALQEREGMRDWGAVGAARPASPGSQSGLGGVVLSGARRSFRACAVMAEGRRRQKGNPVR